MSRVWIQPIFKNKFKNSSSKRAKRRTRTRFEFVKYHKIIVTEQMYYTNNETGKSAKVIKGKDSKTRRVFYKIFINETDSYNLPAKEFKKLFTREKYY